MKNNTQVINLYDTQIVIDSKYNNITIFCKDKEETLSIGKQITELMFLTHRNGAVYWNED